MLLARLSWPAIEPLPPYCGVRRVMSVMRPVIVGSVARSSRITAVAAPVRPELNTGSLWPTTVIVSATLATLRREIEILGDAQAHADVVLRLRREAGKRRRDRCTDRRPSCRA